MNWSSHPKNAKLSKFNARQILLKSHLRNFSRFSKTSAAHVRITVCVLNDLNLVDKRKQNSIGPFCDSNYS